MIIGGIGLLMNYKIKVPSNNVNDLKHIKIKSSGLSFLIVFVLLPKYGVKRLQCVSDCLCTKYQNHELCILEIFQSIIHQSLLLSKGINCTMSVVHDQLVYARRCSLEGKTCTVTSPQELHISK